MPPERIYLVDAQTGQELLDLADRSTIYLDELPTHPFSIRANVVSPVARVVFRLDGPLKHTQTETQPPYGVFGSEGTGYHHKPFELGAYTLEAQAFRLGYACSSFKIHFRIQDKRP
ncbi:MAG: hypothetical protein HC880_05845 [Bacteroidia bacterium]|nr:hypothetical protein [Bacteroidia bacterium]